MDSVIVLLSTYNGEKYLKEQLESLINQKEVSLKIFVRDDGSTDNTIEILKEFEKKFDLNWYSGVNLKPAFSFLELVTKAPVGDFYAFCDQDDVWYEEKLINAINQLKMFDQNELNLYMSTYDVVDSKLNFLYKRDMNYEVQLTLESTIVERSPSGCTMVFNNSIKEKISLENPSFIRMHDYWTLLVVEAFQGNLIVDDVATLMYRQHNENVVGVGKGYLTRVKRLLTSAIDGRNERQRQAIAIYECYGETLPKTTIKSLMKVKNYKNSLKSRCELAFDKRFRSTTKEINLLFVCSVLLGLF